MRWKTPFPPFSALQAHSHKYTQIQKSNISYITKEENKFEKWWFGARQNIHYYVLWMRKWRKRKKKKNHLTDDHFHTPRPQTTPHKLSHILISKIENKSVLANGKWHHHRNSYLIELKLTKWSEKKSFIFCFNQQQLLLFFFSFVSPINSDLYGKCNDTRWEKRKKNQKHVIVIERMFCTK